MEKKRLAILAAVLLTGCAHVTQTVSPTEVLPLEGTISPIVLCSTSDENNPTAISMFIFKKGADGIIEMDAQRLSGSKDTKPALDGGLNPVQGKVRTGLNGVLIPYAKVNEKILYLDLGGCLVDPNESGKLKSFFKEVKPDQFQNPGDQISFDGRSKRFTSSIVNPRGAKPIMRNIYTAQKMHFSQPQGKRI